MSFGPIEPAEPLTRFIFYHRHFNKDTMIVNHGAFEPPVKRRDSFIPAEHRKTSVCRIKWLGEGETWREGERIRGTRPPVIARADIQARAVPDAGLSINPGSMRTRHADIVGWERESLILLKATQLAHRATLRLPPG